MRKALGAVVLGAVVCSAAPLPAAARGSQPPAVVAACANPALPAGILAGSVPVAAGVPARPLATVEVRGGNAPLTLAVAADEGSRELGLMCVTRLQPRHGMIFVFEQPSSQTFWMKNTLVPLDMVWVGADGRITTIAEHVPASTRETPDDQVARRTGFGGFVIELRDGDATLDGLRPGIKLSLPKLEAVR